jgi:hypothetical protein
LNIGPIAIVAACSLTLAACQSLPTPAPTSAPAPNSAPAPAQKNYTLPEMGAPSKSNHENRQIAGQTILHAIRTSNFPVFKDMLASDAQYNMLGVADGLKAGKVPDYWVSVLKDCPDESEITWSATNDNNLVSATYPFECSHDSKSGRSSDTIQIRFNRVVRDGSWYVVSLGYPYQPNPTPTSRPRS